MTAPHCIVKVLPALEHSVELGLALRLGLGQSVLGGGLISENLVHRTSDLVIAEGLHG